MFNFSEYQTQGTLLEPPLPLTDDNLLAAEQWFTRHFNLTNTTIRNSSGVPVAVHCTYQTLLAMLAAFVRDGEDIRNAIVRKRCQERQDAWRKMPLNTLPQAKLAYRARLAALGIPEASIRHSLSNALNVHLSNHDPRVMQPKTEPKVKNWYNAKTDVLWHYHDTASHREEADYRWTHSITSASTHDAILQYFSRKRILNA